WPPDLFPGDLHRSGALPRDLLSRGELACARSHDRARPQRADDAAHPADQRSPGLSPRAGLSHAIDEDDTMSRHRRKTPPPRPAPGRLSAAADAGADRVMIPHPSLQRGDRCPGCTTGKIYPLAEPATLVRITGMAPLSATVYACDRWRCNLCGEVFTAPAPAGVGDAKYDATATSMVGLRQYG